MTDLVETVARAIADADKEDYMEDCRQYDARARAALAAIDVAGCAVLPKIMDWRSTLGLKGEVTMDVVQTAYNERSAALAALSRRVRMAGPLDGLKGLDRAIALARIELAA